MNTSTLNLDKIAAECAQNIVKNVKEKSQGVKNPVDTLERLVTKTLGVLQQQGIYAMMLFLFSRTSDEKKIAPFIRSELYNMVKKLPEFENETVEDIPDKALQFYSNNVLDNLDTLFLFRDLFEQTLIYTRFGAKAASE
ncbi:MAG TPA: hypothetical protein ENJ82_07585 [Bacteroidetes bacterium]|nr:hypothetical protein [Bacteroidota bacterium]